MVHRRPTVILIIMMLDRKYSQRYESMKRNINSFYDVNKIASIKKDITGSMEYKLTMRETESMETLIPCEPSKLHAEITKSS
jgi:hypothetical protein